MPGQGWRGERRGLRRLQASTATSRASAVLSSPGSLGPRGGEEAKRRKTHHKLRGTVRAPGGGSQTHDGRGGRCGDKRGRKPLSIRENRAALSLVDGSRRDLAGPVDVVSSNKRITRLLGSRQYSESTTRSHTGRRPRGQHHRVPHGHRPPDTHDSSLLPEGHTATPTATSTHPTPGALRTRLPEAHTTSHRQGPFLHP